MKFKYSSARVQFSADGPLSTVYRPLLPVRVAGPSGAVQLRALLDTGADCSVFPLGLARELGVDLQLDQPVHITGIEGAKIPFYMGEVDLKIKQRRKSHVWKATLLFGGAGNFLLGQLGFFEFFTVSLDYHARQFEVLPNARLAES